MLEIRNLNKSFGKVKVLKNISLNVKQGEIIALLGPSGSGKSTLLRCINCLEIAQSGSIRVDTCRIDFASHFKDSITPMRKNIGMVFQNYNLFANKSALDNISEALIVVQKKDKREARRIAMEHLKMVGLEDKKDFYPNMLSGGQAQRVSIARAMALHPKIILFDEPTSALDVELVGEVLNVIKMIATNHNQTMLIVTHELDFARAISDKIAFLSDGELIEFSPTNEFFTHPKSDRAKKFLNNINIDFCI